MKTDGIRPRETRPLVPYPDLTGRSATRRTIPLPPTDHAEFPTRLQPRADPSTFPPPILHPQIRKSSGRDERRTWEPLGIPARHRRRRRRVRGTFAPPPPALMGWGRNGWVGQHRRARGVEEEEDDDDEVGEHGLERWVASRIFLPPSRPRLNLSAPVRPRSNVAPVLRPGPCTTPVSQNRAPPPSGFTPTTEARTIPRVQRSNFTRTREFFFVEIN